METGTLATLNAPTCFHSTWTGDEEGLPIIRDGRPFRCHGDSIVDDLRIARARLDRSLKTLRKCMADLNHDHERYDIGYYIIDVIDDLECWAMDFVHSEWFSRTSAFVLRCVKEAEIDGVPEPQTWSTCLALGKALGEHSKALRSLSKCECQAAQFSVHR